MASALTSDFCLMMAALVIAGLMVVVAFVRVHVEGPGGERIGEILPFFGAARHF
jgi:hypothetical protein